MSHPRNGHELSNDRSGATVNLADLKASAKSVYSAYSESSEKDKEPGYLDKKFGEGTTDAMSSVASTAYEMSKEKPVAERYAGSGWTSSEAFSDEGFQRLRKKIDEQAAQSEATRAQREKNHRERVNKAAGVLAVYAPYGTLAAAALIAVSEAMLAANNLFQKDLDSKAERDRAQRLAKQLFEQWMIAPPSYYGDLESAKAYADRLETLVRVLQASEDQGEPWRAEWLKTMAAGIDSPLPAARDMSALGWIPVNLTDWIGVGYANGRWKAPYKSYGFGAEVTVTQKPGKFSAAREKSYTYYVPTYEEMQEKTDKYAAGVGVMVATRYGVALEPVVEAAVTASRQWLEAAGPNADLAGFRLKGVFEQAVRAAQMSPPNPMLVKRRTADGRVTNIRTVKQEKEELQRSLLLKPGAVALLVQKEIQKDKPKKIRAEDRGFRHFLEWRIKPYLKTPKTPRKTGPAYEKK